MQAMFKPLDGILLIAILATAFFWSRCNKAENTEPESLRIVTSDTDDTLSLFRDTTVTIDQVTIEIRNREAAITHSDCHTQQCVHTGYISAPGQMSACMPNGVWIEILGSAKTTDVISY